MKYRSLISGTGLLLAAALAVAVIIIVNNTFTGLRLDLTEGGLYTLSTGSRNILKSLDEPVSLDFYFSRKTLDAYPGLVSYANRVRDLLEEYSAESDGRIRLTVIEPEPFSEQEDQAVASGLQGVAVNQAGDLAYFGLVGTNSVDEERTIPFFQTERQGALEYDLTKLIYNLAYPDKRVVGVLSGLPIFGTPQMYGGGGMPQPGTPWVIVESMREFFTVRELSVETDRIDDDIDVLMVIHPQDLGEQTRYAIDQFVLRGGNAMIFVDPLAEAANTTPDPQNPMVMPDFDSELDSLFAAWGIELTPGKVVGDLNAAMRVQTRTARGPQEILYLPWLRLGKDNLDQTDFTTNELEQLHLGSAGELRQKEGSTISFTPLLTTSSQSMLIDRDRLIFQQDPASLLDQFVTDNQPHVLAVRLSGTATSAFPGGPPDAGTDAEATDAADTDHPDPAPQQAGADSLKQGSINVIVVADTDILSDALWIRSQNFLGTRIHQAIANNGDFIINALDNLSGNNDLISLRSRGEFSRPFTLVEAIRRAAEEEFREQESQLQARLKETEERISALQQETGGSGFILSPEQAAEIEKFREQMVTTRKDLRSVQHELQKNIERLGSWLKFVNIGLVPLFIVLGTVAVVAVRSRRTD